MNSNKLTLMGISTLLATLAVLPSPNAGSGSAEHKFRGDVEGYVKYAMEESPSLRASFQWWRSLVHSISRARRLPEPKISYGFFLLSVETRVGPQRHRVGLSQTFPWPTKLTSGADAVAARARAAQHRFDAAAFDLRARVSQRYWYLWLIREKKTIRNELLDIAQRSSETVQARLVVGDAALSDQQQVDLFITRLEDSIASLEQEEIVASARLASAVGASIGLATPTAEATPMEALPIEDIEMLRASALEHPQLDSFELRAQGSEAQARSVEAERFPSITLGVDWIEVGEASMPDVEESGRDALVLGVGLSLPLWQRSYKESVDASLAEAAAHRAEGRAAADQALFRLEKSYSGVGDSYRRIGLHRHTLIPQASAALDSVLGAYSSGRAGVASVLMAEQELLEIRIALVQAQADHQISWAWLEALSGRTVRARVEQSGESR